MTPTLFLVAVILVGLGLNVIVWAAVFRSRNRLLRRIEELREESERAVRCEFGLDERTRS